MTWVALIAIALAALVGLRMLMGKNREGWEALAAALMVGLAGYALQGAANVPSAMKPAQAKTSENALEMVGDRHKFSGGDPTRNKWIVIADALASRGDYANAATILRGAVEADPKNMDAWVALGNALVGHAEGHLSPSALYAFRRAAEADPASPSPPMFLGLAMAREGRFEETRALWQGALGKAPADAPWRGDMAECISRLDKLMQMIRARQEAQDNPTPRTPPAGFAPPVAPAP